MTLCTSTFREICSHLRLYTYIFRLRHSSVHYHTVDPNTNKKKESFAQSSEKLGLLDRWANTFAKHLFDTTAMKSTCVFGSDTICHICKKIVSTLTTFALNKKNSKAHYMIKYSRTLPTKYIQRQRTLYNGGIFDEILKYTASKINYLALPQNVTKLDRNRL